MSCDSCFLQLVSFYTARCTLPERRQRVQTFTRFGVPFTIARTLLMFGFQVRLERLCEWLTLIPKDTPFPQISHFAIPKTPPIMKQYRKSSSIFCSTFVPIDTHYLYLNRNRAKLQVFFSNLFKFPSNRMRILQLYRMFG